MIHQKGGLDRPAFSPKVYHKNKTIVHMKFMFIKRDRATLLGSPGRDFQAFISACFAFRNGTSLSLSYLLNSFAIMRKNAISLQMKPL